MSRDDVDTAVEEHLRNLPQAQFAIEALRNYCARHWEHIQRAMGLQFDDIQPDNVADSFTYLAKDWGYPEGTKLPFIWHNPAAKS